MKLPTPLIFVLAFLLHFKAMAQQTETVILLHGIGRTDKSMAGMEKALQEADFKTFNIHYPSRKQPIDTLAVFVSEKLKSLQTDKIHFVTHSMGGLIVRTLLENHRPDNLGRIVMLAPPNHGSEIADYYGGTVLYKWFYGPAGQELTTSSVRARNEKIDYELGIIAGSTNWHYPSAWFLIDGPSDGPVSIESTRLPGMKDHFTLPAAHTFIMDNKKVQAQTVHFLRHGHFDHGADK